MLDVQEQTSLANYFVIATVDTARQAHAIEEDLLQSLKAAQDIRPLGTEGVSENSGGWSILDYGDVIVHLFTEETRVHYDLESLWSEANVVVRMM